MKEQKKGQIAVLTVLLFILSYLIIWDYDKLVRQPRKATEKERHEQRLKFIEEESDRYMERMLETARATATKISDEDLNVLTGTSNEIYMDCTPTAQTIEQEENVGVAIAEWVDYVPVTKFIIEDDNGEDIGELDWSTGRFEFRGKMSSSARSFFKYFLKPYVDDYIKGELDKRGDVFDLPEKGADNEGEILVISDSNEIIAIWHDIWKLAYTWQGLDAGPDSSFWMHEEVYQRTTIAGEFIEWLYENDYEIVKKEDK